MEDDNSDRAASSETARLLLPGEKVTKASKARMGQSADPAPSITAGLSDSSHIEIEEEALPLIQRPNTALDATSLTTRGTGSAGSNEVANSLSTRATTGSTGSTESSPLTARSNSAVRKVAAHPMTMSRTQQVQRKLSFGEEEDLESGDQPQCRICLESDGRDFIAPCKCKGSSQFVHRECLDQWRSTKEGFAFAHCTTCKMPYHIRVQVPADARWRTAKFRVFVTRDALVVILLVQMIIGSLAYVVYGADTFLASGAFKNSFGFQSSLAFYYLCGLVLFFFFSGLLGGIFTCVDRRFRSDIGGPCRELCACCCNPLIWGECHCCSPLCFYTDCTACADCATHAASAECLMGGGMGETCAACFVMVGVVAIVVLAVVGIFYSLVVAAVVAQRIWQRHYHILAKRMLTKEYVVEDLAGQDLTNYTPPPLPAEHEKQLKDLGLL